MQTTFAVASKSLYRSVTKTQKMVFFRVIQLANCVISCQVNFKFRYLHRFQKLQ